MSTLRVWKWIGLAASDGPLASPRDSERQSATDLRSLKIDELSLAFYVSLHYFLLTTLGHLQRAVYCASRITIP